MTNLNLYSEISLDINTRCDAIFEELAEKFSFFFQSGINTLCFTSEYFADVKSNERKIKMFLTSKGIEEGVEYCFI